MEITGKDLTDIRSMIAMSVGHKMVISGEERFLNAMEKKSKAPVMKVSEKQYEWLLHIINRVVTYDNLHGGKT